MKRNPDLFYRILTTVPLAKLEVEHTSHHMSMPCQMLLENLLGPQAWRLKPNDIPNTQSIPVVSQELRSLV